MDKQQWLSKLKVGDTVVVANGHGHVTYSMDTVDKLTATQVVVGPRRFRRDTGRMIGEPRYSRVEICEPAGKPLDMAIRSMCESRLYSASRDPSVLTTAELRQIAEIVEAAQARAEQARKDA